MGSTQFGNFHDFCRDTTLPVCNLFVPSNQPPNVAFGGCALTGIHLTNGRYLGNLGSILAAFLAILACIFLLLLSERKRAAVGRREIQLFLLGYIVISICEIFTVGAFPLSDDVRKGFSAVHVAAITATTWILFLNALVGFQLLDDGTPLSVGLFAGSAIVLFIGTGYIALDTGFSWTGHFDSSLSGNNRNIGLYVLYLLFPLVCLFFFYILEVILVLRVLGERRPLIYLTLAALLFAIGQIFDFVISPHICNPVHGKINGAFFETLFSLFSVVTVWLFWSSITEDDWPAASSGYT
ncbi:export control protein CHS7-like, putative [Talaromyces stipitatus ATCC 10500]|uniref:Export control protein CHS7-like, putative n=1 Tax=Talaromyces stipitatus (strain ATCC 10500 / CBS 375.48 / QM 6759 / NRRL 1006) TaxID=441959 RepID=B8ML97_TALSN|nr:export control protein CHS7-like, putative [Talaromyces stipitatus ATCC 10500]EED15012.1 export control protein CHS7-like, putative [Talaromyces stipitatus ATCC 10500]